MAKRKEEIENLMITPVIPLRRPTIEERSKHISGCRCHYCNDRITTSMDDYIIIDDMTFCCDEHVTEHFIKEAGGRRVYGGAC